MKYEVTNSEYQVIVSNAFHNIPDPPFCDWTNAFYVQLAIYTSKM